MAKTELIDIMEYIAQDSIPNAKRFISEITEKYRSVLSIFPDSGKRYKNNIRQISFKGYTALSLRRLRAKKLSISCI